MNRINNNANTSSTMLVLKNGNIITISSIKTIIIQKPHSLHNNAIIWSIH